MRPLRIGVNALYLIPGGVGGTEIYLRGLLRALARIDGINRYTIFTNRETSDLAPDAINFHAAPQPVHAVNRPARILWEQTGLLPELTAYGIDVLLNPGFTAPLFAPCPMVTVFHDLQHKRHPENFRWFDLPFWRALLFGSARRSAHLLADSEATRNDLLKYYALPDTKVTAAPLAADEEFFAIGKRRDPQPYLLAVSTLHPHKNLDALLQAFATFSKEQPVYKLVVTGVRGFSTEPLERLRADLGLEAAVEFTGWIPRTQVYELYAGAHAFFYPSRFEGFGLPVVEALAAGIPTACSDIPPLREIAGDAALLFPLDDPSVLLNAMRRVTMDSMLRENLSMRGPARAAQFSWENTARITLNALELQGRKTIGSGPEPFGS